MFVKKFEAPSLEQALVQIKSELGPNALILSTAHHKGKLLQKGYVEVTAAYGAKGGQTASLLQNENSANDVAEDSLDRVFPHRRRDALRSREVTEKPQRQEESLTYPQRNRRATTLEDEFIKNGFSAESAKELSGRLIFEYPKKDLENPSYQDRIKAKLLISSLRVLTPEIISSRAEWVFLGAPGSGKTSLITKVAIDLKRRGLKVSLCGGDKRKLLGQQELKAYAKLIGVGYLKQSESVRPGTIALIDTPSLSPDVLSGWDEVQSLGRERAVCVVVDGTMRLPEALNFIRKATEKMNVTGIGITRLDMVSQRGFLFDIIRSAKLPLLGASISPSFQVPFKYFEAMELANFILKGRS